MSGGGRYVDGNRHSGSFVLAWLYFERKPIPYCGVQPIMKQDSEVVTVS